MHLHAASSTRGHGALIAVNHVDATDEPLYRKFLPCGFMRVEREGIAR